MLFKLYSDGSSFNNGHQNRSLPMVSACGVVLTLDGKIIRKGSKVFYEQTISFAELKAAILALDLLKARILDKYSNDVIPKPYHIEIHSDSQYVVKSVNEWMPQWLKQVKNYKTDVWYNKSGGVVGNYLLFKDLKERYLDNDDFHIKFFHVKAHTGANDFNSRMNAEADYLATLAKDNFLREKGLI